MDQVATLSPRLERAVIEAQARATHDQLCRDTLARYGLKMPARVVEATHGGKVALFGGLYASMAYQAWLQSQGMEARTCSSQGYTHDPMAFDYPHGVLFGEPV